MAFSSLAIDRFARWYAARQSTPAASIDRPIDRTLRSAARLWARFELPYHVRILEALMVNRPALWAGAGTRECRGSWHGYRLRLDLTDFYQRWAYFLTRYHEFPLQLLLRRALVPSDTFIDGGANNGLVSLVAAWRVGPRGRVIAFEPNPAVFEQLRWHINANRLAHLDARREGLSDRAEELPLVVPGADNLGAGTFSAIPARYHGVATPAGSARTIRGDDLELPSAPLTIKLDVEGFELRALRGLSRTITTHKPLVITEINREMLIAAGDSPFALFEHMHSLGYRGYGFDAARSLIRHRRLRLWQVQRTGPRMPRDIAWVHANSPHAARLDRYILTNPPPDLPGL